MSQNLSKFNQTLIFRDLWSDTDQKSKSKIGVSCLLGRTSRIKFGGLHSVVVSRFILSIKAGWNILRFLCLHRYHGGHEGSSILITAN